jgi:hypothetical protein
MNIKNFSWLLLSNRLNTKDLLQRRHWNVTEDYSCVLCPGNCHEDRDHLFFNCIFSRRVWIYLQIQWGAFGNMVQTTEVARKRLIHFFLHRGGGSGLLACLEDSKCKDFLACAAQVCGLALKFY